MTSLATVRVIGLVLFASPLVLVYFAARIVCLRSASLNWMSRASPYRCVSFSCRLSRACLLTVRQPLHGCLSRVLRQAGCHARHLAGCRTTSCVLQD